METKNKDLEAKDKAIVELATALDVSSSYLNYRSNVMGHCSKLCRESLSLMMIIMKKEIILKKKIRTRRRRSQIKKIKE